MSLPTKIRKLREQRGWSQLDIAHRLDVSQAAYNKWESGQSRPTIENLQKLSEVFEVDFFDLLQEQIPNIDFSNSKFDGSSYVVNPIVISPNESTVFNFHSQEMIDKIFENQKLLANLVDNQNKLLESLLKK